MSYICCNQMHFDLYFIYFIHHIPSLADDYILSYTEYFSRCRIDKN
jgi:hypothetical protein